MKVFAMMVGFIGEYSGIYANTVEQYEINIAIIVTIHV